MPDTEPTIFLTQYRDYTGLGDKAIPTEVRQLSGGRVISVLRLISVSSAPKAPFASDMFDPPTGYQLWPACDHYQAAQFSNHVWRQTLAELRQEWLVNGGKVADGIQFVVLPSGKPQDVRLINPVGKPSTETISTFMSQSYQPATCDGKPVTGMIWVDFTHI
ncbi:MAG: hypothetical protein WAL85_07145 [Candidatus Korobacteraceae bacterium]